jgi:hypothetical protein
MSNYIPTKRSNPCPICEKTNGNCRTFEDGPNILCMTFTDPFAQAQGFRFIGLTEDHLWGKWIPDNNQTLAQEEREQKRQELNRRRQERAEAEAQRRAEALPAQERDRLYRQLLSQLPLHPADREDLKRRGLTDEQIEAWGARSVEQWQRLSIEMPHSLPGVSLDGRSLIVPRPGYLCPIRDVNGLIVGFQLRSRTSDSPRYSWLTGKTKKRPNGPTPHLPIGELPLSIVKPEIVARKAIALVEGLGAKPIVLAQRLNLNTIGAAGGMFGASAETLKLTLDQLGIKNIEFYPDAGAVQNQSVLKQYRTTWNFLRQWGYEVKIAWWGQDDKRVHPDIDELTDLSAIKFLSVAEFEAICAKFNRLLHKLQQTLAKFTRPLLSIQGFGASDEKDPQKTNPNGKQRLSENHEVAGKLISKSRRGKRAFRRVTRLITSARRQRHYSVLRLEHYRKRLRGRSVQATDSTGCGLHGDTGNHGYESLAAPLILEYESGDRLSTWQTLYNQGYKNILDVSSPGTGKSHDSGLVTPELFGVQQVIYLSDQHRNPTVETLGQENGWSDLEARHAGLTRVTTNGGSRLQRSVTGDIPSVSANCSRNKVLNTLRDKHVSGADTANLICGTCILREACINADGPGYGYLNQRRNTLGSPLLRAHPDSLPDPEDFPLDDVLLIWDEPSQNFQVKNSITVTYTDLQQTIAALMPYPELFCAVQPLLAALLPLLDGSVNLGRHGFNHLEVVGRLPSVSNVVAGTDSWCEAIAQVLAPQLGFLNTTSDYGVDLADLPRELRKKFSERDGAIASQASEVVKQWLAPLVRVLQGSSGCVQVTRRGLTLSLPGLRHRTMAAAARGNVFLDGTLTREDLALKLGCSPDEIMVVHQKIPATPNLEVIQVPDVGRLGMQRGGDQKKRTGALSQFFHEDDASTRTIDFKNQNADGAWWRDSRGVNDFLSVRTLVLIGTPCRNLFDLGAEFTIVSGRFASDDDSEFQAFVHRTVLAEIHQAIGRLRAHRRLDESLRVVLVSNVEMDIPVAQVNARDISLEAAGKKERVVIAIEGAILDLKARGEKITQQMVAALTGIPRGTIAGYWSLLISLIKSLNSKTNNFEKVSDMGSEGNQAISGVLNEMADLPMDELLSGLNEVFFDWLKPKDWPAVWDGVNAGAQVRILQSLSLALPEKVLQMVV